MRLRRVLMVCLLPLVFAGQGLSMSVPGRTEAARGPHRPSPTPSPSPTPTFTATSTPTPVPSTRQRHPVRAPRVHSVNHRPHSPHVLPPGHEGCGGQAGKLCSTGEFCQFLPGSCSLQGVTGLCVPQNVTCTGGGAPVCGCNGVTYSSDCQRQRAGVSPAHSGPC